MGVKVFALIVWIVILAFVIWVIVVLGNMPGKIAEKRGHPNKDAVRAGGWATLIILPPAWPFVLMWAYSTPARVLTQPEDVAPLRQELVELRQKLEVLEKGGEA